MPRGKRTRKKQRRVIPVGARLEAAGILLIGVALITIFSLLSFNQGLLTGTWLRFLRLGFGWGAYVLPVGLGAMGFWLFLTGFGRSVRVPLERVLGILLLFVGGLAISHYFADDPRTVALAGGGGGHLGWWISTALISGLGDVGALLVILAVLLIGLIALFSISVADVFHSVGSWWQRLLDWYRLRSAKRLVVSPPPRDESLPARLAATIEQRERPARVGTATPSLPGKDPLFPRVVGDAKEWRLPPMEEILERTSEQELSQAEIRAKVRIIEETLANFGVPAKVVEVNQGPTVTQFGVEPGFVDGKDSSGKPRRFKVKVNRISALANDLALALAASPIRIEAPVPGRSLVGIEVPNVSISLVSLRSVMESEAFRDIDSRLRIALGQDVAGQPVAADLSQMPHLLIAGATGSGKSVCVNAITACLLLNNTPDDLRLIMVDPKMVELTNYNGIPHLLVPVVVEVERVVVTLKWVTQEMDR
ncbi:MAG: hypothetical protein FJ026_04810, partial [Chloroflexi bacterium]|nr:hypothetical protein [Chloroflexota bacterium]